MKGYLIFPHTHTHKKVLAEKERKREIFALAEEGVNRTSAGYLYYTDCVGKGAPERVLSKSFIEADVFYERNILV